MSDNGSSASEGDERDPAGGREGVLGFRPQKEMSFNFTLPYSAVLDAESNSHLADIKANLGRAVLMGDFRPGALVWVVRLFKYIRLNGYKFSKEDHLHLIHLLFNVFVNQDVDFNVLNKFGQTLTLLLRKRELLTPSDLQLPWRPIYQQYRRIYDNSYEALQLLAPPTSLEHTFKIVLGRCSPYFPVSATAEMLEEWMPWLCITDSQCGKAIAYLEMFLPTVVPPEAHLQGFKLWFDTLMALWGSSHFDTRTSHNLILPSLILKLAEHNIGFIDWTPHLPMIYTKTLTSFNLPVGYKKMSTPRNRRDAWLEVFQLAQLLVSTYGSDNGAALEHLKKLFAALDSYYHPSNYGTWNKPILELLSQLSMHFCRRVHKERYRKQGWDSFSLSSHHLTDQEITDFVKTLLPAALLAMYNKAGGEQASHALHSLALLRPELVCPPVIERLYAAHETLTEPHTLTSAIRCVLGLCYPMLSSPRWYPEGPTHVLPLLTQSLPGLDPNDNRKCLLTLNFIATLVGLIAVVDCSNASEIYSDLSPAEQQVCMATAGFEEFVLQFMDRCFTLITCSSPETLSRMDRPQDTLIMNTEQTFLEKNIEGAFAAIINQCSKPIFMTALDTMASFVMGRALEPTVAGKYAGAMVHIMAVSHPYETLNRFLPRLTKTVIALTTGHEETQREENVDPEIIFNLLIIQHLVGTAEYDALDPHLKSVMNVLDATLHMVDKEAARTSVSILATLLNTNSRIYPKKTCMLKQGYDLPLEECLYIREWGKRVHQDDAELEWYVPGPKQVAMCKILVERYLFPEMARIEKIIRRELTLTRDELEQCLCVIHAVTRESGPLLPAIDGEFINLEECSVSLAPLEFASYMALEYVTFPNGRNVRVEVANLMHRFLQERVTSTQDNAKVLGIVARIVYMLSSNSFMSNGDYECRRKAFSLVRHYVGDSVRGRKTGLRSLIVARAALQNDMRVFEGTSMKLTPVHVMLMKDLFSLSTSRYAEVRIRSQALLFAVLKHFPYSYKVISEDLVGLLKNDPSVTHEQFKGALYVLQYGKQRSIAIKHDWAHLLKIWPALVSAQHDEKPSIVKLLDSVFALSYESFETFDIEIKSPSVDRSSAVLLWETQPFPSLPIPTEKEQAEGRLKLADKSAANVSNYLKLNQEFVNLINSGNL